MTESITDVQKLYYNANSQVFSVFKTHTNHVVFETHQREGQANEKDVILQDLFRIEIGTNFYPKAPKREYIYVNIYINNILLLPVSKAWRKVSSQKTDIIKDIFIEEWGNNIGVVNCYPKSPSTIVFMRKNTKAEEFCWYEVLSSICQICNNYENWITNEVNNFVTETQKRKDIHWRRLSSAVSLIRTYDMLVPGLINIYRPAFDDKVVSGMQSICKNIKQSQLKEDVSQFRISQQEAETLWRYITDFLM